MSNNILSLWRISKRLAEASRMLNRLLGLKIISLKYLPTERLGLTEEESKSLFDVYCKDRNGRSFLIEMQMWTQPYFHKRAVCYSSLSVQDQGRIEKIGGASYLFDEMTFVE